MISMEVFRELAHNLGEVTEAPHFERTAFRVNTGRKKKGAPLTRIFATYDGRTHRACLKLSPRDQDLFTLHDTAIIYPVPNKWGKQGWTYVELKKVKKTVLRDALKAAMEEVLKKQVK